MLGIQFAPLKIPLTRRLETLAAGAWFSTLIVFGSSITFLLIPLIILYTNYWLEIIVYMIWAFTIDKDTSERGGRRIEWVRNWSWWKYLKNYFPIRLIKVDGVELDSKRNYLFCSIPHGLLSTGSFSVFATNHSEFKELFPHHQPNVLTLRQHFHKPFFRELMYSLGMCSATKESINWLLGYPGGGKVAIIVVGGVAEAFYCRPGVYKSVINKRKGFVRIAMQNGSAIVPTIAFGETDIFSQVDNPKGSVIRYLQELYKKLTGIAPIIPLGRGFFQYTFGLVPHRKPITVVVGKPMDVPKIENPTQEEVDSVHAEYLKHLLNMFETEKHKYVENPETTHIEFGED